MFIDLKTMSQYTPRFSFDSILNEEFENTSQKRHYDYLSVLKNKILTLILKSTVPIPLRT